MATKKQLANKAVKKMRVYLGSIDMIPVKKQQIMRTKLNTLIFSLCEKLGTNRSDLLWEQVEEKAREEGIIHPRPGQHY